jgi:hypothetical protein
MPLRHACRPVLLAAALAALGLSTAPDARADMTLEEFREYSAMPGGGVLVRSYMSGLRDGMIALQANLSDHEVADPTFCPDPGEIETGTTFEETVFAEIEEPTGGKPWPADTQLSEVVAVALQEAYPCRTYRGARLEAVPATGSAGDDRRHEAEEHQQHKPGEGGVDADRQGVQEPAQHRLHAIQSGFVHPVCPFQFARPAAQSTKPWTSATSSSRAKRPAAPAWPAVMLVCSRIRPVPCWCARSAATHFAGSQ